MCSPLTRWVALVFTLYAVPVITQHVQSAQYLGVPGVVHCLFSTAYDTIMAVGN